MSKKTKLNELAALAGGWDKLTQQIWPLLSKNKQDALMKHLKTPAHDPLELYFKEACKIKAFGKGSGRPNKYNQLGLLWVWQALNEMKRLGIGTSRLDRLKKIICFVIDSRNNRLTGLSPSMKDRLRDHTARAAVPEIDLDALCNGKQKPNTIITSYAKHLNEHSSFFKILTVSYDTNTVPSKKPVK